MSPVHHEDVFRAGPTRSWESSVDKAIEEARERGDFDDLPGRGKPLKIESNVYEPEMTLAYSTLKNAGYAPAWMELDRKITAGRAELDAFLERSASFLASRRREIIVRAESVFDPMMPMPASPPPTGRPRSIWRSLVNVLTFASGRTGDPAGSLPARSSNLDDFDAIRLRMRDHYLERAAALDKMIAEFHGALPRNLWHLERTRLTQEAAARRYDARFTEPGDG
jgi:hypothetical protein